MNDRQHVIKNIWKCLANICNTTYCKYAYNMSTQHACSHVVKIRLGRGLASLLRVYVYQMECQSSQLILVKITILAALCFHGSSFHVVFFFFSSRRRHTRLQGDWSSDVCSSD